MRRTLAYLVVGCLALASASEADEPSGAEHWRRVESRYCTIWFHPLVEIREVGKKINTWRVRPQVKIEREESDERKLAAKCDAIFMRAQEILDMYPAGIHTTIRIVKDREEIEAIHAKRYGYGTEAVAFYDFEDNTIFVDEKDISEGVLAHEMAHSIVDHYFRVRPPRKIEEMLAIHVDEHLKD